MDGELSGISLGILGLLDSMLCMPSQVSLGKPYDGMPFEISLAEQGDRLFAVPLARMSDIPLEVPLEVSSDILFCIPRDIRSDLGLAVAEYVVVGKS